MTTVVLTPASTSPWTCPAGVHSVDVQAIGAGGNGGVSAHGSHAGGSGPGGEYAENTSVPVTPGNTYVFSVPAGGSGGLCQFTGDSGTSVTAHSGGNSPGQAAGTTATGSTDPIHFDGGAGQSGAAGNNQSGAGGGSSASPAGAGNAGTGATGGTAPSGGGNGGAGGGSLAGGSNGSGPGGGGGGGGSGGTINHTGGTGGDGQITLIYTVAPHTGAAALTGTGAMTAAAAVTLRFTASLSGTGTLAGSALFAAAGALTGTGTLGGTAVVSGQGGATLSGTGTMTANRAVLNVAAASLSGTGTITASAGRHGYANLSGTGTITAIPSREAHAHLAGSGSLGAGQVVLGFSAPLSGTSQLLVARVLGVINAQAGAGFYTRPYCWAGTSQMAIAPQGSGTMTWLGHIGDVTALKYSFTCPGGADKASVTVMRPALYRTTSFDPGSAVRIFRGGHQIWDGKLDEPDASKQGWSLTASGTGNRGQDFRAVYSVTWPGGQPDNSVNGAIARGLPWVNPGVGSPAGAWFGQGVDSGAQTITALLNLICTRGGLTWYVNSQPGGLAGSDLSVYPIPTTPNRLLVVTTPVSRTLGADINTIYVRYQATADSTDSSGNSTPATYALTVAQNALSVARHGEMEEYIDLSDAGVMSAGQAQAVAIYVLAIYQRAGFGGPFTASFGELLNMGGQPIDPGTDQAGTVVQPLLLDYGYGGEVVPGQVPVFMVGGYEWDDIGQAATITPYQNVDQSLTGLLSIAGTVLAPITSGG